jgi:hypothetical protein
MVATKMFVFAFSRKFLCENSGKNFGNGVLNANSVYKGRHFKQFYKNLTQNCSEKYIHGANKKVCIFAQTFAKASDIFVNFR